MKSKALIILFLAIPLFNFAQYTSIPDSNFENALSDYDDIPNDGQVPTTNINTITYLDINSQNIFDLTGIEDFTNLQYLNCHTNQLTSLDVTGLSNLKKVDCPNNQLTSLDIAGLSNLEELYCDRNQLSDLNTTGLVNLQIFWLFENEFISLDATGLSNLQSLVCFENQLTNIDVSGLSHLEELICDDNQLTSIDMTGATNLQYLVCHFNQLTNLNVTELTNLFELSCYDNNLTDLDVRNGNNTNIYSDGFLTYNNPNLTCIFVDDVTYSSTNWTNIDPNSTFVETETACDALSIDDETIKQNIQLYPNPTSDTIYIKSTNEIDFKRITLTNVLGQVLFEKKSVNKIDLSYFKKGIYFIKIEDDNGNQISYKIIKK